MELPNAGDVDLNAVQSLVEHGSRRFNFLSVKTQNNSEIFSQTVSTNLLTPFVKKEPIISIIFS